MTRKLNDLSSSVQRPDLFFSGKHSTLAVTEMDLPALRKVRQMSQTEIANILKVNQAEVSKMERRPDMYVSTLVNFIQALGGSVEIIARFAEAAPVRISQFHSIQNNFDCDDILLKVEQSVLGDENTLVGVNTITESWSFSKEQVQADTAFGSRLNSENDWFNQMLFHPA